MGNLHVKVLGLFSSLSSTMAGGLEASGRIAWSGIVDQLGREHALLFCYEKTTAALQPDRLRRATVPTGVYAASKLVSVIAALRIRWPVRLVLVWHLGLLKLLPFFRIREAKVALFLHGVEGWRSQGWLTGKLLRRVDFFLSNSEYAWQRFLSFNPGFAKAPHQTVHLGIGMSVNASIPSPADPPAVLMISRLLCTEDYKGHREMIAAWPSVLQRIPAAELWIAGNGDLREALEQMVQSRGLAGRIRFFGQVSEEEKENLLVRCRCLAMPSRSEGFGLVYLEAMRMGRPCLVSTLDAGREIVHPPEAGLAADPGNPQALAEAVCRLLTPGPEWERWSIQARRRYDRYFTAGHFQERLLKALTTIEI